MYQEDELLDKLLKKENIYDCLIEALLLPLKNLGHSIMATSYEKDNNEFPANTFVYDIKNSKNYVGLSLVFNSKRLAVDLWELQGRQRVRACGNNPELEKELPEENDLNIRKLKSKFEKLNSESKLYLKLNYPELFGEF